MMSKQNTIVVAIPSVVDDAEIQTLISLPVATSTCSRCVKKTLRDACLVFIAVAMLIVMLSTIIYTDEYSRCLDGLSNNDSVRSDVVVYNNTEYYFSHLELYLTTSKTIIDAELNVKHNIEKDMTIISHFDKSNIYHDRLVFIVYLHNKLQFDSYIDAYIEAEKLQLLFAEYRVCVDIEYERCSQFQFTMKRCLSVK